MTHGGAAPQVKAKAQQRLLEAADSAAAELVRLALKAESEQVRVSAIRDLLDRAGLAVRHLIEAQVTHHDGDSKLDAEIADLMAQFERLGQGSVSVGASDPDQFTNGHVPRPS